MPHVLTRTRAVVGGGILAVLLLACFGAPVGARDPADARDVVRPSDSRVLTIEHDGPGTLRLVADGLTIVSTLERISIRQAIAVGVLDAALASSAKTCWSQEVRTEKWGGNIWFKTKTKWCGRNGIIVGNPSLSRVSGSKAPEYTRGDSVRRTGGGNGSKDHSDKGKAKFLTCNVRGQDCRDYYHVLYIIKRQTGSGGTSSSAWYTTESR